MGLGHHAYSGHGDTEPVEDLQRLGSSIVANRYVYCGEFHTLVFSAKLCIVKNCLFLRIYTCLDPEIHEVECLDWKEHKKIYSGRCLHIKKQDKDIVHHFNFNYVNPKFI